ncbi:MAG: hypothetical protein J5777_00915 [Clostridiales bacterium]|nr:hypothetical protein [Clostridiales bacterium]
MSILSGMNRPEILSRPPSIEGSFGGSQMWAPTPLMQNCGCGIIAGLDTVMRLSGEGELARDEYIKRFNEASRYIRPIILPGKHVKPRKIFGNEFLGSFGVSTGRFRRGIKKLALSRGIGIKIKGFIFKYEEKVKKYLDMGVPVIALIAAPFNNVKLLNCHGVPFNVGFHWVTVTGIDDRYMEVSSWGGMYKIELKDLDKATAGVKFYAVLPYDKLQDMP